MKIAVRHLVSAIVLLTLLLGSTAMASAAKPAGPAPIYLQSGAFIPGQNQFAVQNGQKYFIVQFSGPVEEAWKEAVVADGGEFLDYIPDFAFKVRMNPAVAARVAQQPFVTAVIPFQAQFKFGPGLVRDGEVRVYRIRVESGADYGLTRAAVAQTGAEILGTDGDTIFVAANGTLVDAIAEVVDVASIGNFYLNEPLSNANGPAYNDTSRDIIGAGAANTRGYDGSSQIVAVADTGLGGGTASTAHRDIPSSRVTAIYNWPGTAAGCFSQIQDDGSIDVDSGHGTHTAGSVLSAGEANGIGRGSAPAARLVFQSTESYAIVAGICKALYGYTDGYYLTGLPTDLKTLFQQAYTAGARVHSNSWGSAQAGKYTADSANTDSFIWTNRDMVITFSAGNEGIDANSDGVIDNDSIGSPATAKNVITVGASENQRTDNYPCDSSLTYLVNNTSCAAQNGVNSIFTYGGAWPADYPANPIKDDSSANSAQQMAAFSSRGPADDTRIKPDVVAPGTWIISTYSDLYQQGYDASPNPKNSAWQYDGYGFPYNAYYKYLSGTSMSNPLTAGGAAVVKDYYSKAHGINASAALVKATIINSAVDMLDENNDGVNDNDFPIPNSHEGWGLVNLDAATNGASQYIEEGTGLSTNGTQSFNVTTTGGPLKVTLVWSDYPSTDTATINLVNDLDLTVSGSSGTYLGNVFSGGWSSTGGSADRRNNVENVYIQAPAAGTYTITVKGYNVPNGPQKFALVVTGGTLSIAPTPTPVPTVSVHAGDLDGTKSTVSSKYWKATVTVTVHNASEQPVSGVTVSGTWSGGFTGTDSCVTDATGKCSISTGNVSTRKASVTFTVNSLSGTGFTYTASANHDPDGDSNGTAITVTKP